MKRIYAEVGFGNDNFLSTEIEDGKKEYRISKSLILKKILEIYIRVCILKKVFIISSKEGIKLKNREKNKLKLLLGVGGVE